MTLHVQYLNDTTGSKLSPLIWAKYDNISLPSGEFVTLEDDFTTYDGAGTGRWVETQATSGTVEGQDALGGLIRMDAGATTADQGIQIQTAAESFIPTVGKELVFEAHVTITNTSNQIFVGLSVEDTTLFATGENSSANHIGFEMGAVDIAANAGKLQFVVEDGGTRTKTANVKTLTSGTEVRIGFVVDTDTTTNALRVTAFVDNVANATVITTNIPTTEMAPSFVCQAEGTTQPTMDVDIVKVAQRR